MFSLRKPRKKTAKVFPELSALKKEKEKQERALRRLEDLYLYSTSSMSEKDFIIRKTEITSRIENINKGLGMLRGSTSATLSDEDFIKQASHLLIAKQLDNKQYVYYKTIAQNVAPDILKSYLDSIIDSIKVSDGRITSIMFKNGLLHHFFYD